MRRLILNKWLSSAAKTNLISKHSATAKDFKESVELDESKWEYQDARGVTKTGSLSKTVERQGTDVSYIFKGDDGKTDVVSGSRLKKMKKIKESVIDEASLIPQLQTIVKDKQHAKIKGMIVDTFTASMITQIYSKVNDANKAKMDKLPLEKLVNIAHKMMKK